MVSSGGACAYGEYARTPARTTIDAVATLRHRPETAAHIATGKAMGGFASARPRQMPLMTGEASESQSAAKASVIERTLNCSSVRALAQHRTAAMGITIDACRRRSAPAERATTNGSSGARARATIVHSGTSQRAGTRASGENRTMALGG